MTGLRSPRPEKTRCRCPRAVAAVEATREGQQRVLGAELRGSPGPAGSASAHCQGPPSPGPSHRPAPHVDGSSLTVVIPARLNGAIHCNLSLNSGRVRLHCKGQNQRHRRGWVEMNMSWASYRTQQGWGHKWTGHLMDTGTRGICGHPNPRALLKCSNAGKPCPPAAK